MRERSESWLKAPSAAGGDRTNGETPSDDPSLGSAPVGDFGLSLLLMAGAYGAVRKKRWNVA
ncbi:MAG: hypothetical protein LBG77_03630 [Dysgonamonadaceae bacterium]|nr:hypothetical protein [Dysgonamonadaceae bacterium]